MIAIKLFCVIVIFSILLPHIILGNDDKFWNYLLVSIILIHFKNVKTF